jgi:nicotinamidase/pyrazinamidase
MAFPPDAALLIVDVQHDFCEGGALAVPGGDEVVPMINEVARAAAVARAPVFASRDWHPPQSSHFTAFGGAWPVHCVQNTPGAALHHALELPQATRVVTKGDSAADPHGYDAFDGHLDDGTPLARALRSLGVTCVVVAGLATDYCVRNSVFGARRAGFEVTLLRDAVRAVDVGDGDGQRAIADMIASGARVTDSEVLLRGK